MAKILDENSLRAIKTYLDGQDNNFVHKSGPETISGAKSFSADVTFVPTTTAADNYESANLIFNTRDSGALMPGGRIYVTYGEGDSSSDTMHIGSARPSGDTTYWKLSIDGPLFANGGLYTTTINSGEGDLVFSDSGANFRPDVTTSYPNSIPSLGTNTYRWKDLYLNGDVYVGGAIKDYNGNSKTLAELIAGSTEANPTLAGTEANLTSIKINQTKYNVVQWDSAPTSGHGAGYAVTSEGVATAIANAVSSVYRYKGSVASYANLPSTGLTIGDVYNVQDTGANYAWTGTAWDELGGDVNNYVTINGNQTISGTKSFSSNNGILITNYSKTTTLRNENGPYGFTISSGSDGIVNLVGKSWSSVYDGTSEENAMDLGRTSQRWKNLYLSGSISNGTNSVTIAQLLPLNQGIATEQEALAILQGNA